MSVLLTSKPFRLNVLFAQVRAHIRQFEFSEDATVPIGPYFFFPSMRMLMTTGTNVGIQLTEKETAMLKYLHRIGNRAVPRLKLLEDVWGYMVSSVIGKKFTQPSMHRARIAWWGTPGARQASSNRHRKQQRPPFLRLLQRVIRGIF